MNNVLCASTRSLFSQYLDGAVSGRDMQTVAAHLQQCAACSAEFDTWRSMQSMLSTAGSVKAPVDLGLKLRVAISQEAARRQARWQDWFGVRWDNLVRPLLLQASAGLAGTILLVGGLATLVGVVAAPQAVMANDEPLGALSPPRYAYSMEQQTPVQVPYDASVVVEAKINADGLVYDYTILSGPQDPATLQQVRHQLMLQVYTPAKVFGAPISGQVLVNFAGVQVHG